VRVLPEFAVTYKPKCMVIQQYNLVIAAVTVTPAALDQPHEDVIRKSSARPLSLVSCPLVSSVQAEECRVKRKDVMLMTMRGSMASDSRAPSNDFRIRADNSTVMMWTSDQDNLCDWVNRAWLDFTGRPMEQQLGNGWAESVHPNDLSQCLSTYTDAFHGRKAFSMHYRLRRYDGEYRSVLDIGDPYFSPDGQLIGYLGSCIDVTEGRSSSTERSRLTKAATRLPHTDCKNNEGPSRAEIHLALEQIIHSDLFQTSPQMCAFLKFIVEAKLRGESERIKGYTIAVSALGRPDNFDPQADPIVRVEAGRLRRALARYYAGAGANDSILIDIPRGGYVPQFHYRKIEINTVAQPQSVAELLRPARTWLSTYLRRAKAK
jgi:PAS domain S-box-containing protein